MVMTYWLADEARASEARYNNDDRAHKRLVVPGYNTRSKRINRGTSHFSNLTEPHHHHHHHHHCIIIIIIIIIQRGS